MNDLNMRTHLARVNITSSRDSKRSKGPSTVISVLLLGTGCSMFKQITAGCIIHRSIDFLVTSKGQKNISKIILKSDNKENPKTYNLQG